MKTLAVMSWWDLRETLQEFNGVRIIRLGGANIMEPDVHFDILLARERAAKKICADLNNFVDLRSTLMTVIGHLRELTSCEAVGIRLHDEGDYPYYVYDGFPESFVMRENTLCARDGQGHRIESPDGRGHLLECMCGNIIRGRFDHSLPFFTDGGSFWSNHTSAMLAATTEVDRQAHTRNTCNSCGYESVALVPIKVQGEIIGLAQFNDHRQGMFSESLVEYIEMIGEHIGLAVRNSSIHEKLKQALEEIRVLRGILPICAYCKKIRDDQGSWWKLEAYICKHSEARLSHGICPQCMERHHSGFL
jgi:hypothetical protein